VGGGPKGRGVVSELVLAMPRRQTGPILRQPGCAKVFGCGGRAFNNRILAACVPKDTASDDANIMIKSDDLDDIVSYILSLKPRR
jgi:hypothetical protein